MSKMLRNYQYLVGTNPNREYESADLKTYIEGEVGAAVQNIVGFAPEDLDTLSELATAIGNDPSFLTTLQAKDVDLLAAVGIDAGDQTVGLMTTPELPDNVTVKALFEAIGEAARRVREGLGVAQGESDLGTFSGSIISDGGTVKSALQEVETYLEGNSAAAVQADVDQNEIDSDAADAALSGRLDVLEADPTTATAVAAVQADVDANETASDAADAALSGRLDTLEADPTTQAALTAVNQSLTLSLGSLADDVNQNELDADAADAALSGRLDTLEADPTTQAAVTAEAGTRAAADTALDTRVTALEVDPATATAVAANTAAITAGDAATLASANAYTDAEVASLIDSAPGAINTLNELAAAIGDDANFAATITNSVAAETSARTSADAALDVRVDALEVDPTTATAVAAVQSDVDQNEADADAADAALSARLDTLEADPTTAAGQAAAVAAVQSDVDQNEADADAAIAANEVHIDNLVTLSGVAKDDTTLGSFGGATISNGADIKQALGELEASVETRATTAYVDNELAALVDGAPTALNTLNEIAAAISDDANIAGTLTGLINANEAHVDNLVTLSGVAKDATNLGSFTGATITNDSTVKVAIQELETAFEAFDVSAGVTAVQADVDQNEADSDAADAAIVDGTTNFTGFQLTGTAVTATGDELNYVDGVTSNIQTQLDAIQADVDGNESDADTAIAANETHIDNLATLSGVAKDETHLSTFTGSTIADNQTVKAALQALETKVEAVQTDVDGNESDADTAIALKADIDGPTFTGVPAAPTASAGTNSTQIATTAFVSTAVANLIDGAPGALDTLNELAAALGDDASFSTTITNAINANETHIDNAVTLTGVAKDAVNLGTFTGSTISDSRNIKQALQELETKVEAVQSDVDGNESDADTAIAANETHIDNMATLTGVAKDATHLATFTGSTINDNVTVKAALQALETKVEDVSSVGSSAATANEVHIDNLVTLSGVAKDATHLGTFTGSTISDNGTAKAGIQELETALELRATIASPTFTGTPAAPTASAGTNTTQLASTAFVTGAVSDLVGTAPSGLDTLGELATAIQEDTNAIGNLTTLINANTSDVADLRTTQGTADGATHLGTFTGSIIADNQTVKAALQALETRAEATNLTGTFADLDIGGAAVTYNEVSGILVSTAGFSTSGALTAGGSVSFTSNSASVAFSDTAKFVNGLVNASDDTAAASGGVAVGELYRDGSVVMIRVS